MKLTLGIGLMCWLVSTVAVLEEQQQKIPIITYLKNAKDLSKFYEMVHKDEVLRLYLEHKKVTVFAPTNEAFNKARSRGSKHKIPDEKIATYHVVGLLINKDAFRGALTTNLHEAPPVYPLIRELDTPGGEKEYFVNNARILREAEYRGADGPQLLYIIDEVLEPFIPNSAAPPPLALEFLQNPSIYNFSETLTNFMTSVMSENMQSLFEKAGNHTYFIPVTIPDAKINQVDQWVIKGHMIPNEVRFTRTMGTAPYASEAQGLNVKVELSLVNNTDVGDGNTLLVQSNTVRGDSRHRRGVVLSRILRANIPVKNGVVHLIEKPLMIIDRTVWDFIEREKDGQLSEFLSEFYRLVEFVPEVRETLKSFSNKTVFIPTNRAVRDRENIINEMKTNKTAIRDLLRLHIAMSEVITTEDVRQGKTDSLSADQRRQLYFQFMEDESHRTLSVEGGGVKSTAVVADIGATDGIIHFIDFMLGMPNLTIYQKMKKDPDFEYMFDIGKHNSFNEQLSKTEKRFTYFVPSQEAWDRVKIEYPSEYKQLRMEKFKANAEKILQRHLLVGRELSSQKLGALKEIETVSGKFKIKQGTTADGGGFLVLEWEGMEARIYRPDIQATNGVIHVLDRVLMKRRDLTTNGASRNLVTSVRSALFFAAASLVPILLRM